MVNKMEKGDLSTLMEKLGLVFGKMEEESNGLIREIDFLTSIFIAL